MSFTFMVLILVACTVPDINDVRYTVVYNESASYVYNTSQQVYLFLSLSLVFILYCILCMCGRLSCSVSSVHCSVCVLPLCQTKTSP